MIAPTIKALRAKLQALPRFSFLSPAGGGVVKVADNAGAWIERDAVAALLEPEAIDKIARPQPMSTAPEDGTEILAFKTNLGWVMVRYLDLDNPASECEGWHVTWDHHPIEDLACWLPLPEAPQ